MWAYNIYFVYNLVMVPVMVASTAVNLYRFYAPTIRYSRNSQVVGEAAGALVCGTISTALASGSLSILMVKSLGVMLGIFISSGLWDVVA